MPESRHSISIARATVLVGLIFCCHPPGLFAQEAGKSLRWYDELSVNAFVSTSYSYNFNKPDTMKNQYRVFDYDDNSIKLDAVELSIARVALNPGDAGFRADLMAGSSIPALTKSYGMDMGDFDIHQIFATYIARLGSGLRFDAGKFITPAGLEVIEGYDGYNDNYSHSFLFGYAMPYTHTGVKASYAFSGSIAGMVMLVNGWDNAVDNNRAKSVGVQLGVFPLAGMNLYANYLAGPEKPDNTSDNRQLLDLVGSYRISSLLTIGVNADYGTEERSTLDGNTAEWQGAACYLRLNVLEDISLALRAEVFHDWDGVRTGTPQKLQEMTFTVEYRPADHLVLRGDGRYDKSDGDVFQTNNVWTADQTTVALNMLFVF